MTKNWKGMGMVAMFVVAFWGGGFASRGFARQGQGAQNPNIPTNMKQYYVAFLVKSDSWKEGASDAVVGPLVPKHMEFVRAQAENRRFALVGPFLDHGRIFGMAVVRADSPEEAKAIVDKDPFMPTGLVSVEIHPAYLEDLSGVKFEYPATTAK